VVVTKVLGGELKLQDAAEAEACSEIGSGANPQALLGIGGRASVTRFIHGCPKGLHQGSGFAIRGGAHQQYCEAQHPLCPVRCGRRNDYRFRDSLAPLSCTTITPCRSVIRAVGQGPQGRP
jgi:hypothetical protein